MPESSAAPQRLLALSNEDRALLVAFQTPADGLSRPEGSPSAPNVVTVDGIVRCLGLTDLLAARVAEMARLDELGPILWASVGLVEEITDKSRIPVGQIYWRERAPDDWWMVADGLFLGPVSLAATQVLPPLRFHRPGDRSASAVPDDRFMNATFLKSDSWGGFTSAEEGLYRPRVLETITAGGDPLRPNRNTRITSAKIDPEAFAEAWPVDAEGWIYGNYRTLLASRGLDLEALAGRLLGTATCQATPNPALAELLREADDFGAVHLYPPTLEELSYDEKGSRLELRFEPKRRRFWFATVRQSDPTIEARPEACDPALLLSHFVDTSAVAQRLRTDWSPLVDAIYDGDSPRFDQVPDLDENGRDALLALGALIYGEYDNDRIAAELANRSVGDE